MHTHTHIHHKYLIIFNTYYGRETNTRRLACSFSRSVCCVAVVVIHSKCAPATSIRLRPGPRATSSQSYTHACKQTHTHTQTATARSRIYRSEFILMLLLLVHTHTHMFAYTRHGDGRAMWQCVCVYVCMHNTYITCFIRLHKFAECLMGLIK